MNRTIEISTLQSYALRTGPFNRYILKGWKQYPQDEQKKAAAGPGRADAT
jgi:hypothetical protein